MILVLDNIRSSHNVGSIFRTADALGTEKIYLCGITAAPFDRFNNPNQKLSKVSLGAEKSVLWEKVFSASSLIKKLKKEGFIIASIEQSKNSIDYRKIGKKNLKKLALVLGSETKGISRAILKLSDYILEIPMKGKKESLNVAVAFGIVGFSL